jgi:pyrimidine deaminase RibD-like protein
MPLEGHYERQTTPLYKLSKREIWVAASIVAVTLVTVIAMVAFTSTGNTNPAPAVGCINPTVAGIVGAETLNRCGQEAVETCSHAAEYDGPRAETIVANCEKQAVKF